MLVDEHRLPIQRACRPGDLVRPAQRRRAAKGWLDWLKAHEPVVILEKTVHVYHITDPAPRTAR